MRRFFRVVRWVLLTFSLLLFVCAVGMSFRSLWVWDYLSYEDAAGGRRIEMSVDSNRGRIALEFGRQPWPIGYVKPGVWKWKARPADHTSVLARHVDAWWWRLGFAYEGYSDASGNRYCGVSIPYALTVLLTFIGPFAALIRCGRKRKPIASNLCANCGYDLRATPDPAGPMFKRCPECGRESAQSGVGR